jgi:hypothetical protein
MTDLYLLPGSIEDVGFPVSIEGVPRLTVEGWVGEVAFLPWSPTASPPIPDVSTTWIPASWDTAADTTTLIVTVGPAPGVFVFDDGTTHRAFVRITGGTQVIEADAGTITAGVARTYSGNPSTSPADAVRFLIGDTSPPYMLSNAEIGFALTANDDRPYPAAADLADALAARFTQEAETESTGDMSVTRRRAKGYMDLATRLRSRLLVESSVGVGRPVSFLLGRTGHEAPAAFWIGVHDHPEAGPIPREGLT